MIIRQFLSNIANEIKSNSLDDYVSPKYIYFLAQTIIADFLKKDNSANRLVYKIIEGWSEVPNLPMIEVPVTECNLDTRVCQKLMKSKYRLPAMYESKFGGLIKQVLALNLATEYTNIYTPKQWVAASKRQYGNEKYYFFQDGYLFIPIKKGELGSPELVRLEAYFKNKKDVDLLIAQINSSDCEDCNYTVDTCKPFLDYEMVIPFYLENDVVKETINHLRTTLQVTPDENPNQNQLSKINQQR